MPFFRKGQLKSMHAIIWLNFAKIARRALLANNFENKNYGLPEGLGNIDLALDSKTAVAQQKRVGPAQELLHLVSTPVMMVYAHV